MKKTYFAISITFACINSACDKHRPAVSTSMDQKDSEENKKALEDTQIKANLEKAKANKKSIDDVMVFLQSEKFIAKEESSDTDRETRNKNSEEYAYQDFRYEDPGLLVFSHLHQKSADSIIAGSSVGYAIADLEMFRLNLKSCKPVVSIRDHSAFLVKGNPSNLKDVVVKGMVAQKSFNKKDDETGGAIAGLARTIAVKMTDEDLEKLKATKFPEFNEREVRFTVTADMAPRIKAALEDLLRSHGVEVSKY